jgi:hypothetical protein
MDSTTVDNPGLKEAASEYEAPKVEEDLPLEVASLACSGTLAKAGAPLCSPPNITS